MPKKKKKDKDKQKKKDAKAKAKADKEAAKAEKKKEEKKKDKHDKKKDKHDDKDPKSAEGAAAAAAAAADSATKAKNPIDAKKVRKELQEKQQQYVSPFSDDLDEGQFGFGDDQAADLADLEHMLNVEVDEDFFAEPRYFHTLRRVINVLGIQLNDDAYDDQSGKSLLERNPAYQNLQKQASVVESAIEHMSRVYCNALNRSVIQVGRIAREFDDAIGKVEGLRRQLRVIQETIGARERAANKEKLDKEGETSGDAPEEGQGDMIVASTPSAHMSLRELWMKKLESEALLSLIAKINIVREAPGRFDNLTAGEHKNCRIGAATLCLTEALNTMFSDDVSQVDALSQILENLMTRKGIAASILWETLEDILYLRTANGSVLDFEVSDTSTQQQLLQDPLKQPIDKKQEKRSSAVESPLVVQKAVHFDGESVAEDQEKVEQEKLPMVARRIYNPFHKNYVLLCVEDTGDRDDLSVDSQASESSDGSNKDELDYQENENDENTRRMKRSLSAESMASDEGGDGDGQGRRERKMMIPMSVVKTEVDLVADEMRCYDFETTQLSKQSVQQRYLPRYTDPVLSLRLVTDCLARIGQLPLAESILLKNVEAEIKSVIQKEQARTFYRLDRRKPSQRMRMRGKAADELKDLRRHFMAILSSFGCIMMRLSHFAELSRTILTTDEELSEHVRYPSNFLRPVLDKAYSCMQSEIKDFLRACLQEHISSAKVAQAATSAEPKQKTKIFSFGVLETDNEEQGKKGESGDSKQDRKHDSKQEGDPEVQKDDDEDLPKENTLARFKEMPVSTFVFSVLFPMTETTPQVQHALVFRRSIDLFTDITKTQQEELAQLTEETSIPALARRRSERHEMAIEFLDKAIEDTVLPKLQTQGVNNTIIMTEMQDAFEPPAEANVYARADKIQPLDVAMVHACEGMLAETEQLFMAIHRLPPGGSMYTQLVQILEFLITTFNSIAQPKVDEICVDTTADELLEGYGDDKGKLSVALGKRDAFKMLLNAYEFDLDLMDDEIGTKVGADANGKDDDNNSPEKGSKPKGDDDLGKNKIERFGATMKQEMELLKEYLDFLPFHQESLDYDLIADYELKQATCLAHSLLKVASIMEGRLKSRAKAARGTTRLLENTKQLHDTIKTLKSMGMKMAKFCHVEVLLQL